MSGQVIDTAMARRMVEADAMRDASVIGRLGVSPCVPGTRGRAISRPCGVTYAMPDRYVRELLQREELADVKKVTGQTRR